MAYGRKQALKDFTFTFSPGVYGLLGPNGAGKSTLINILTTYLAPTQGRILLNGVDSKTMGRDYRRSVGFMPQRQALYDQFTFYRFLDYIGAVKDIPKKQMSGEIKRVAAAVNLAESLDDKIKTFSGGMRQRAMLAQALLGNPDILILDEPSAGLDPKERNRLRNLIARLSEGKIVIVATHIVSDIELIADQILMLCEGTICCSGSIEEVCGKIRGRVYEETISSEAIEKSGNTDLVTGLCRGTQHSYIRRFYSEQQKKPQWSVSEPNLEDLYLYFFHDGEGE